MIYLFSEIMTPKSVIFAISEKETIGSLLDNIDKLPLVESLYYKDLDTIVGSIVRRRDLLSAKAKDQDSLKIRSMAQKPIFIEEST